MQKKVSFVFKIFLSFLFFLFTTIYISNKNGYYAYSNYRKNIMTEENIKMFENDIESGNAIDITNYLEEDKDYSNKVSRLGLNISNKVGRAIRKGIISIFDKITKSIE